MRPLLAMFMLVGLSACVTTPPPNDGGVSTMAADVPTASLEASVETAEAADAEAAMTTVVLTGDNPEISSSQEFSAVVERETIESDAERLKAQREQFQIVAPTALPTRGGNTVNVAEYALATTHNVGEKKYRRSPLGRLASKQACARYRVLDEAQEAFLKAGGPKRDPKSLDPDGDGFACAWSPDRYRKLLN